MATVRKLVHQAAHLGQAIRDAQKYGWKFNDTGLAEVNVIIMNIIIMSLL